MTTRQLTIYRPQQSLSLVESLVLREAFRRGDIATTSRITSAAVIRSLGIPPRLLDGPTNYSSARADHREYFAVLRAIQKGAS